MSAESRLETRLIHAGEPRPRVGGAAVTPIFQSVVFENRGGGQYEDIPYPRLNNLPNHKVLGDKIASIEGGEQALVLASGMAAISNALLGVLRQGDHLLVQDCLYGGTQSLVSEDFPDLGIEHDVIATADASSWEAKLRPNTKAIYVEAITNPTMQVIDHNAVVAFAKQHGLVTLIDATFTTPVNFRPLEVGYDLSLHSATKYMNGHSDIVAGVVAGSRELVGRVAKRAAHFGGSLDPHACFLFHRGLRTLALRVHQHNQSALAVARFLSERGEVSAVNYPGLESHPQHAIARELFRGFGGMLSFELAGGAGAADRFIDALRIPIAGPSLGGIETLVSIPARLSHLGLSPDERARMGVSDGLIRMSIGIEAVEDLTADLGQALEEAAR